MRSRMRHTAVLTLGLVLLVMVTAACGLRSSLIPSPSEEAYDRGRDYEKQGDYENAIDEYGEAIRLDPQDVTYYTARGMALVKVGQKEHFTNARGYYEKAIEDFTNAMRLAPPENF